MVPHCQSGGTCSCFKSRTECNTDGSGEGHAKDTTQHFAVFGNEKRPPMVYIDKKYTLIDKTSRKSEALVEVNRSCLSFAFLAVCFTFFFNFDVIMFSFVVSD